jgi:hypothetical protein
VPTKSDSTFDPILAVKLAETSAEGVWGSARSCAINHPMQITQEHIEQLGARRPPCYNPGLLHALLMSQVQITSNCLYVQVLA